MVNGDQGGTATKPRRHPILYLIGMLLILVVAVIWWQAVKAPRGLGLLETLPALLQELPNKDEQRIGKIILDNYQEYRGNTFFWSAAYFGCLFFSAVCAALAGLVIKLEFLKNDSLKKDLAAVLAMVSALLITLSSVGNYHEHWLANRLAAAKTEKLGYAFMAADRESNLDAFLSQIQEIGYERNQDILSEQSDRSKTNENKKELPKSP